MSTTRFTRATASRARRVSMSLAPSPMVWMTFGTGGIVTGIAAPSPLHPEKLHVPGEAEEGLEAPVPEVAEAAEGLGARSREVVHEDEGDPLAGERIADDLRIGGSQHRGPPAEERPHPRGGGEGPPPAPAPPPRHRRGAGE